jgi:hypothetical protein
LILLLILGCVAGAILYHAARPGYFKAHFRYPAHDT